jgi:hypothetical protein
VQRSLISKNAQNISWPLHTNMISSKQNLAKQEMISEFMVYARSGTDYTIKAKYY